MNWKQAWNMTNDTFDYAEASTVKVYGSELYIEGYHLLLQVLGQVMRKELGDQGKKGDGQREPGRLAKR